MTIEKTIQDLVIITQSFLKTLGSFQLTTKLNFVKMGLTISSFKTSIFLSKRGVIRGLHLQINPLLKLN
jgi:dTDP-4-dehydrorhamnose 3,5-epimerase-like enzyme